MGAQSSENTYTAAIAVHVSTSGTCSSEIFGDASAPCYFIYIAAAITLPHYCYTTSTRSQYTYVNKVTLTHTHTHAYFTHGCMAWSN